jgi:glycosidase
MGSVTIDGSTGWNSLYIENHDQPRSLSRFGTEDPKYRTVCAKMLGTFLLSLRGTIYLYQGQELGMPHPDDWKIEDYKDVETQQYYKAYVRQCRVCQIKADSNAAQQI